MSLSCVTVVRISAFLLAATVIVVIAADPKAGTTCDADKDSAKKEVDDYEIYSAGPISERYSMNFKMPLKCVKGTKKAVWQVQECSYVEDATIQPWHPGETQRIDLTKPKFTFYVKCNPRKVPATIPGWIGLDCTEKEATNGRITSQLYWAGTAAIFVKLQCVASNDGEKVFRWHARECYPRGDVDQEVKPDEEMTLADKSKVKCNELSPPSKSNSPPTVDAKPPKRPFVPSKVSDAERNKVYMETGRLI